MEGPRVTMKEMARQMGLSESTVSRALSGSPLIAEKTRKAVEAKARELKYEVNTLARGLRTSTTRTIGIIHNALLEGNDIQQYGGLILHQLRANLEPKGYDLIASELVNRATGGSNVQRLIRQNKADGFIFLDSDVSREDCQMALDYGKPAVQLHFYPCYIPSGGIDTYVTDNEEGSRMVIDYLLGKGCRRIFLLSIYSGHRELTGRREGAQKALESSGLASAPEDYYALRVSFRSGYLFAKENARRLASYDAVYCHADIVALGVVQALKEEGVRVPEEVKVVGYDDILLASEYHPSLTTVHQPDEEKVALACNRLIKRINSDGPLPIEVKRIPPRLVIRETA